MPIQLLFFNDFVGSPFLWSSFVIFLLLNLSGKITLFLTNDFDFTNSLISLIIKKTFSFFRMAYIVLGIIYPSACKENLFLEVKFTRLAS